MGLPVLRRPSRQRHKRGDKYHASRKIPAEVAENYRVGRPESNAYEKSATALSVGIPRHNATAFGGGRMSIVRHMPSSADNNRSYLSDPSGPGRAPLPNRIPPTGEHRGVNRQQDRCDQRKLYWIYGPQQPAPLAPGPDAFCHARAVSDQWPKPKPPAPHQSQRRENDPDSILSRNPVMPVILSAYPDVVCRIERKSAKGLL